MTLLRGDLPADGLLVIEVDGEGGVDAAADGALADRLVRAFAMARDGVNGLGRDGCVLFVVSGGIAARAGVTSLTRTLALEWAPRGVRVNAVHGRRDRAEELIRFIASPAARMLTGAVVDAP